MSKATNNKEELAIVPMKRKITRAVNVANDLMIEDQEAMVQATDILGTIKQLDKLVKKAEKSQRDPLNAQLKAISEKFKPLKDDLSEGESIIKDKMLDYEREIEAKRAEEAAKLEARVEKGTMRTDTAMRKMDELETVGSQVQGNAGTVQFRTVQKIKITDPTKIPLKYLMDEKVLAALTTAVRTDVLNGVKVDGVEIVEEKTVAAR